MDKNLETQILMNQVSIMEAMLTFAHHGAIDLKMQEQLLHGIKLSCSILVDRSTK